ncbi:MAG: hypothetical protein K2H47_04835 [Muribaculaceae bacterium]|nr:hypothetical protein [Muribaculaceae bacterium]
MNKFLATLFAAGTFVVTAQAQTMTVTDTEGLMTKFNIDYVSEVSFVEISNPDPGTVTFTTASARPYSSGRTDLTFTDSNGAELQLFLCGPTTAEYLEAGVYTASPTNSEWTFDTDPNWSWVTLNGNKSAITAGEITVALDGNDYVISFALTLDGETEFNAVYSGPLAGYSPLLELKATEATQVEINDPESGEFYIRFNDTNWSFEMVTDFFDAADATSLTPGVYEYSDACTPGTYGPKSSLSVYNPYSTNHYNGNVTVEKNGSVYSITMDLTLESGRKAIVTYEGEIKFLNPTPDPSTVTLTAASVYAYSGGRADLTFTDDNGTELQLYLCGPDTAEYLEPGVYTASPSNDEWTFDTDPDWSWVTLNGNKAAITAGEMTVTLDGNNYVISFALTLDDETEFNATYSGTLPGYSPLLEIALSAATVVEINDPQPGEFYIRFNDTNWSVEMITDFFNAADATSLTPGVYEYSEECTPGTYGPRSSLTLYTPYSTNQYTGPVTVEENNGVYTITMDLTLENGRKAVVSYEGEINF